MLNPGDIIHGFAKNLHTPKNKYAICIYRDEEVNIVMQFTTSQPRAGVPDEEVHHGAIYKDGNCLSYVFEAGVEIGINPQDNSRFSFPKRTVMTFDYGFLKAPEKVLLGQFDNLKKVCKLDETEYINLIYAMYRSNRTKPEHKPYLDKIITDYYKDK